MPEFVWIIALLVLMMVWGLIRLYQRQGATLRRFEFVGQYRENFIAYVDSQGRNTQAYHELIRNAQRMQRDMGSDGIYGTFQPPYENRIYHNYPIVLNMIPRLRGFFDDNSYGLWDQQISSYAHAIDEALLRYGGPIDEELGVERRKLLNPFLWFRAGVEEILSIPVYILALFGLFGLHTVRAFQRARIFQFFSGIAALISFGSAVMGLVLGWSESLALLHKMLGR